MAKGKRQRGSDEVPEHTKKHPRLQDEPRNFGLVSQPSKSGENLGRPRPKSHRVAQAGSHPSPPFQPPPEQQDKGAGPRIRLKLNPPKPRIQLDPSEGDPSDPGSSHTEASTCYNQSVANYDVEPGVQAVGTPTAEDFDRWGSEKEAAEFIRSKSGLETNWVGIRPLGRGGRGIAGLWEMRDDDGQLIKQMVIKEETHTRNEWKADKLKREVPLEVKMMSLMNKMHCHAIPRLFAYKRYPHVFRHRMYMEFCPFTDLSALSTRYMRFRQFMPEPFLWDTFYHMVEAAVVMSDSPKDYGLEFEIVHRDIKPSNLFLGEENAEKGFSFYPVAKTGDFGLAVPIYQEDKSNPFKYQGAGTTGYFAPEQLIDVDIPKHKQERLSSHTNVWAIGATMLELLTLYSHADYMIDPEYNVNGEIIDIKTEKEPEYSKKLRDLIKSCLESKPAKRIEVHRLRDCIEVYRDRIKKRYEQSDSNERARFEHDSFLYYKRNEINNMPTGRYQPYDPESPSMPEAQKIPDLDWPVTFPRFHDDGPEAEGEGNDDGDDNNSDDDLLRGGLRARKTRLPKGRRPANPGGPRTDHRIADPIVVAEEIANKVADSSDIWRRKPTMKSPRLQPGQGNSAIEIPGSGAAGNGRLGDGGPRVARAGSAAREDGGVEGLEEDMPDGVSIGASVAGTDDQSRDMDEDFDDDSASSSLSLSQVPAPAPAPAPAASVKPVPRKLRSGATFGYF